MQIKLPFQEKPTRDPDSGLVPTSTATYVSYNTEPGHKHGIDSKIWSHTSNHNNLRADYFQFSSSWNPYKSYYSS